MDVVEGATWDAVRRSGLHCPSPRRPLASGPV